MELLGHVLPQKRIEREGRTCGITGGATEIAGNPRGPRSVEVVLDPNQAVREEADVDRFVESGTDSDGKRRQLALLGNQWQTGSPNCRETHVEARDTDIDPGADVIVVRLWPVASAISLEVQATDHLEDSLNVDRDQLAALRDTGIHAVEVDAPLRSGWTLGLGHLDRLLHGNGHQTRMTQGCDILPGPSFIEQGHHRR